MLLQKWAPRTSREQKPSGVAQCKCKSRSASIY